VVLTARHSCGSSAPGQLRSRAHPDESSTSFSLYAVRPGAWLPALTDGDARRQPISDSKAGWLFHWFLNPAPRRSAVNVLKHSTEMCLFREADRTGNNARSLRRFSHGIVCAPTDGSTVAAVSNKSASCAWERIQPPSRPDWSLIRDASSRQASRIKHFRFVWPHRNPCRHCASRCLS
jgi:hypothetical protein